MNDATAGLSLKLDYLVDILVRLVSTPSVTGDTSEAVDLVEAEFARLGLATRRTRKGVLLATMNGLGEGERTLTAHLDTLGAMVKEIKPSGRLRFSQIGGYMLQSVEGENCLIHTSGGRRISGTILPIEASVHVYENPGKLEREPKNMEIRLDEKAANAEEVRKLGIRVGDFISFDPRVLLTEAGFVKSRHLDDKSGVAILLAVAEAFTSAGVRPAKTTHFMISTYEEVGHGAAHGVPERSEELVAVDMGAVGEGQASDEYSVSICAKDSTGPYDLRLREHLIALAEASGIPYRVDIYPKYGSDASAALRSGNDFRAGLVGPGVDASHGYERTHREALVNTARLLLAYLTA